MRGSKTTPSEQEALFGGNGIVRVWNLLGRQSAPPFSAVLGCELEPGGVVGVHVQQRDPEIVIGLSGQGEAEVDGQVHPMETGSVVYLAHGQRLSIRNSSASEPLGYLIIKADVSAT